MDKVGKKYFMSTKKNVEFIKLRLSINKKNLNGTTGRTKNKWDNSLCKNGIKPNLYIGSYSNFY